MIYKFRDYDITIIRKTKKYYKDTIKKMRMRRLITITQMLLLKTKVSPKKIR